MEEFEIYDEKEPLSDGISQMSNPAQRSVVGYGYVILARDLIRADYLEKCFRNNTLTILTDKNEIITDCYVSENVWNYIKFPRSVKTKGSCVVWICAPNSNKATILATVTKRNELQQIQNENSFRVIRENENGTILIEGNSNSGILNFVVDSDVDNGAVVSLRILNTIIEGLLDIYIQGDLNIEVDDSITLKIKNSLDVTFVDEFDNTKVTNFNYTLGTGYTMNDEFGNQIIVDSEGISITTKSGKIILQNSDKVQNSVLGNQLVDVLKELIEEIKNITVMTPSGTSSPPLNQIDLLNTSNKLNSILSKINFLS